MLIIDLLPVIIVVTGAYFLIKLRAFFVRHPLKTLRCMLSEEDKGSSVSSLCLALAGTLGVGNIVGVSIGISIGGAGSVFWLVLSSLFSSVIKYAEITVSSDPYIRDGTGMLAVFKNSFGKHAATLYALMYILLGLTLGSAVQTNAIAECAEASFGIDGQSLIIPVLAVVGLTVAGGTKKIERAVSFIIPTAAIIYISLCLFVIIPNIRMLPSVFSEIFRGAFSGAAGAGGILGALSSKAITEGFARGLLSNEAGAGTSSLAHARAEGERPHVRGLFGIAEVFFDTVILCSVTAFTVLLSGERADGLYGIALVNRVFEGALGDMGKYLLFACVLAFALSTVFCQYYYGSFSAVYVFGRFGRIVYFPIFLISVAAGLLFSCRPLVLISDIILFLMTLLTSAALIKNSKRIRKLSEDII